MTDLPITAAEEATIDSGQATARYIHCRSAPPRPPPSRRRHHRLDAFMSWTYTTDFPGDLTVNGYPGLASRSSP